MLKQQTSLRIRQQTDSVASGGIVILLQPGTFYTYDRNNKVLYNRATIALTHLGKHCVSAELENTFHFFLAVRWSAVMWPYRLASEHGYV